MKLTSTPKKVSGFGRFKKFHRAVGKFVRPVAWVAKRVAPIAGAAIGSIVPGIGTAAGAGIGGAISTGAGLAEKLFAK